MLGSHDERIADETHRLVILLNLVLSRIAATPGANLLTAPGAPTGQTQTSPDHRDQQEALDLKRRLVEATSGT
jgi:hypothetical protein